MKGVTASVPVPEVHRDVLVAVLVYGWMPAIAISPDLPAEYRHVDVLLGEPTHPGRKEVAGGVLLNVPAAPWVVVGPGCRRINAYAALRPSAPNISSAGRRRSSERAATNSSSVGATKPGVGSCSPGPRVSRYLSRISSTISTSSFICYLSFVPSANRAMAIATTNIIVTTATVRTLVHDQETFWSMDRGAL